MSEFIIGGSTQSTTHLLFMPEVAAAPEGPDQCLAAVVTGNTAGYWTVAPDWWVAVAPPRTVVVVAGVDTSDYTVVRLAAAVAAHIRRL